MRICSKSIFLSWLLFLLVQKVTTSSSTIQASKRKEGNVVKSWSPSNHITSSTQLLQILR
jgi:hypothetical protein